MMIPTVLTSQMIVIMTKTNRVLRQGFRRVLPVRLDIRALTGWCICLYNSYDKEPQNSIDNYFGPYMVQGLRVQSPCYGQGFRISGLPSEGIRVLGLRNKLGKNRG